MAGRKPTVKDREFLEAFVISPEPVLFSAELAERFDMTTKGVTHRLRQMEEKGYVKSKRPSRDTAWWITEKGRENYAEAREAESAQ